MFDLVILYISLVLLHLPIFFGGILPQGLLKILLTFPLWLVIIKNLFTYRRNPLSNSLSCFIKQNKLLNIFILLFIIANFRSYIVGVASFNELFFNLYTISTVTLFAFSLIVNFKISKENLILGFFGSMSFYIIVNIGMYFIGLKSSIKRLNEMYSLPLDKAVMLDSFGIDVNRVLFPIANGLNNFGVICGVSLVYYCIILCGTGHNTRGKVFPLVSILTSLMGILLTDSRGALFFTLISLALSFIFSKKSKKIIPGMMYIFPIIIPIFFFSINYITDTMNYFHIYIFDTLSRGSASDLQQFAGRAIVWESAFDKLSIFSINHLIGYGWYGQTTSGVCNDYYKLALMFANPERVTLHNSYLQFIFNIGYLGLIIFLILYKRIFKELQNDYFNANPKMSSAVSLALLFMGLAALLEVNLAMVGDESIYFVMFMFVMFSKTKLNYKTESKIH